MMAVTTMNLLFHVIMLSHVITLMKVTKEKHYQLFVHYDENPNTAELFYFHAGSVPYTMASMS